MKVDFLHNKIVASLMSDGFKESFKEIILPAIDKKYGADVAGVQFYEDHLADGLAVGKTRYYPLSVSTYSRGAVTEWISWNMKKGAFENDVPFAYVGDGLLDMCLTDAPAEIAEKVPVCHYFDEPAVKLRVETTASDISVLSGKYSQVFVDEMTRQLTGIISEEMEVEGIEDSSIELALVFAPESYMEHTSENVTYRRLLLVDKSSAPRDFWIKWTRIDGNGAYTVSDDVTAEDIVFEIGENVPQKIKEKEYRFLTRAGKDKYHNAMGRKNATSWRDVIKRSIRRGDIQKKDVEKEVPIEEPIIEEPQVEAAAVELSEDEELRLAMEMAQKAIDSAMLDGDGDDSDEEEEEEDELEAFYKEVDEPVRIGRNTVSAEEAEDLERITREALEALKAAQSLMNGETEADEIVEDNETEEIVDEPALITFADESDAEATLIVPEDPTAEEYTGETTDITDEDYTTDEEALSELAALEPVAEEQPAEAPKSDNSNTPISAADLENKIRGELEAKIRLEYESLARQKAEAEAERLRREQEQLRMENERLMDRARREKAEWTRIEENRKAEAERLRAQIEAQVRQEAKEKERLAEAARAAVEEQHRLEAERLRAERLKLEEERRIEEERRRREEEERIEAARKAEAERIRRAEEERLAKERAEKIDDKGYVDNNYTYVSKTVKLIFRRSVDPNVTSRIHEIIKATLEYYGKQKVYMRIRATVPDSSTVCLEFVQFPLEEMELLSNIIKVIGNSGLGIAKAILE
ncbi:MAG: hypothetical protein IJY69_02615 [Clostridia bacterium]|nr:hypothetical protein [Clostridia bacterium]